MRNARMRREREKADLPREALSERPRLLRGTYGVHEVDGVVAEFARRH